MTKFILPSFFLKHVQFDQIIAMPVQNQPSVLLDIAFLFDGVGVRFVGEDWLDDNGREVYSLTPYQFVRQGWWHPESDWKPIDLSGKLEAFMQAPRTVTAKTSKELAALTPSSFWGGIDVLQLDSRSGNRLQIRPSYDYPCAVEITVQAIQGHGGA